MARAPSTGRRRQMTIDDLAAETGASSRSIRYYQTRGLLPPPKVKGRQGFYGQRHVERLRLIAELQEEGLNLQAIGWLLGGAGGVDNDDLRRLKRAVLDGWVNDDPIQVSQRELAKALVRGDWSDYDAERAQRLGLLQQDEDDPETWHVLMPAVLAAGAELADMGLPQDRMLDVLDTIREHAEAIARSYVEVFDEAVLAPWDARGRPDSEWQQITDAVDRIRPLAGEALLAVFRQVMTAVITEQLSRFAEEPDDR